MGLFNIIRQQRDRFFDWGSRRSAAERNVMSVIASEVVGAFASYLSMRTARLVFSNQVARLEKWIASTFIEPNWEKIDKAVGATGNLHSLDEETQEAKTVEEKALGVSKFLVDLGVTSVAGFCTSYMSHVLVDRGLKLNNDKKLIAFSRVTDVVMHGLLLVGIGKYNPLERPKKATNDMLVKLGVSEKEARHLTEYTFGLEAANFGGAIVSLGPLMLMGNKGRS